MVLGFLCAVITAVLLSTTPVLVPIAVHAQQCAALGAVSVAFGEVGSGGGDATGTLPVSCTQFTGTTVAFRMCMFISSGLLSGINPRRMTNFNNGELQYDLYSDSARTQLIGIESSGFPVYSMTMVLTSNGSMSGTMPVYGRVHAGQSVPATFPFEDHITGTARLRWAFNRSSTPPSPAECTSGGGTGAGVAQFSVDVTATYANTCSLVGSTDLAFGTVSSLDIAHAQTSTIQLQCPAGAAWQVGLNTGVNGSGQTRRMLGPSGSYVTYELYRDASRTQRWGNTLGSDTITGTGTGSTQSLTVHGLVPQQAAVRAGAYSDTVTVTLTY